MNEPRTLAEAINRIRTKLQLLPWTEQVFGRAHRHDAAPTGADKQQPVPWVYIREGEYRDVRPDDRYSSVLFFYTEQPEKSDFDRVKHSPVHAIRNRRAVTLYGWANLSKLTGYTVVDKPVGEPDGCDIDDNFAEQLKVDIKTALKDVPCVILIGEYEDGTASRVFRPFVVSEAGQYDKMPYHCFRLELEVMTIEA